MWERFNSVYEKCGAPAKGERRITPLPSYRNLLDNWAGRVLINDHQRATPKKQNPATFQMRQRNGWLGNENPNLQLFIRAITAQNRTQNPRNTLSSVP